MKNLTLKYCLQYGDGSWAQIDYDTSYIKDIRALSDKEVDFKGEKYTLVELTNKSHSKSIWLAQPAEAVTVEMNDYLTAKVNETEVVLDGDDVISFEAIEKLYFAVQEKRNGNRIGQKVPFNEVRIGEKVKFSFTDNIYTRVEGDKNRFDHTLEINGEPAYFTKTRRDIVEIVG